MPIYHKTPPTVSGSHATSEIDNHTSEAAKVKRTREHAYFNSYDFDAIEVLPYDEDDDEEGEGHNNVKKDGRGHSKSTTTTNSQQQHLKSKTQQQLPLHSSQTTRQHLPPSASASSSQSGLQQPSFGYVSSKQQHHPHTPTITTHNKISSTSSDNFIVDKHSHLSSHGGGGGLASKHPGNVSGKHSSYLQRFGVALFGGINVNSTNVHSAGDHKASNHHHNSASSSLSTTSTSSSFADDDDDEEDDIKHLKVSSSGISSSASSSPSARPKAKCCSSSASSTTSSAAAAAGAGPSSMAVDSLESPNIATGGVSSNEATTQVGINGHMGATNNSNAAATSADGNFLLPRVMLKYQSTLNAGGSVIYPATNSKSMSTAASAATTSNTPATTTNSSATTTAPVMTGNNVRLKKLSTTSSSLSSLGSEEIVEIHRVDDEVSKGPKEFKVMPKLAKTPGRAASHQSHYSTDKSASSGYYSSNVCSTYSLEEHIYSEPTIEMKEMRNLNSAAASAASVAATAKTTGESGKAQSGSGDPLAGETASSVMHTLDYNRRYRYNTDQRDGQEVKGGGGSVASSSSKEFQENLRILETSIENLDRHLKSFPRGMVVSSTDAISQQQQHHHRGEREEKLRASYSHLPTIKEGYDANTLKRGWSEDPVTDDSLIDIDLDSFLLDEAGKKDRKQQQQNLQSKQQQQLPPAIKTKGCGIDNPSFLSEEQEENHYKCAKYINSCPEDAYRVESDIIAPARSSISGQSVAAVSVTELYPKRYEDQIHFQNTRELLEDVRDKIRLLNLSQDIPPPAHSHHPAGNQERQMIRSGNQAANLTLDEYIPKELHTMIGTLKRELELYLQRMNQNSELEIRQLCTGLVKNQNIVKMKNAFERRRSLSDVSDQLSQYEAGFVGTGGMRSTMAGLPPISIRQEVTTIKCSSDPNFKMKRKSLTEVFPMSECYVETLRTIERQSDPLPPLPSGGSQLQRNLHFHQASIQQFDNQTENDKRISHTKNNGSGSGSASGSASSSVSHSNSPHDSSESQDKDSILDWHRKKPSIWEMYYGTNRIQQSLLGGNGKKNGLMVTGNISSSTSSPMCY
ncbi:uncharacterized protein LOC133327237, partial [Musca vetustissima]|uniref:uncharacterized protein LOC133327237 n=1 Tax=Musca vetustissima TaxID=27455 RepID=UPI002AB67453